MVGRRLLIDRADLDPELGLKQTAIRNYNQHSYGGRYEVFPHLGLGRRKSLRVLTDKEATGRRD